jgi:hypothetical protein
MQAINASGAGPYSRVIEHSTSSSIPGPCQRLRLIARQRTCLSLAWDKAVDNGATISAYHVEMAADRGGPWQALEPCEANYIDASGLSLNQTYSFRVRAENVVSLHPLCLM